jgi:hypothetical protein
MLEFPVVVKVKEVPVKVEAVVVKVEYVVVDAENQNTRCFMNAEPLRQRN